MGTKDLTLTDLEEISRQYCQEHALGDDLMFACVADGNLELGSHIIRTVYQIQHLNLKYFATQFHLKTFPKYHQAVLDGIGIDAESNVWPVEIQLANTQSPMSFDRWQYYESEITTHLLLAGQQYTSLSNRKFIIITAEDYFDKNLPGYTVRFWVDELKQPVSAFPERYFGKVVFRFVGADISSVSPETILAQSLFETDTEKIQDPVIKKWLLFMRSEEGRAKMNSLLQDIKSYSASAEREKVIDAFKAAGAPEDLIKKADQILTEDKSQSESPGSYEQILKDLG